MIAFIFNYYTLPRENNLVLSFTCEHNLYIGPLFEGCFSMLLHIGVKFLRLVFGQTFSHVLLLMI